MAIVSDNYTLKNYVMPSCSSNSGTVIQNDKNDWTVKDWAVWFLEGIVGKSNTAILSFKLKPVTNFTAATHLVFESTDTLRRAFIFQIGELRPGLQYLFLLNPVSGRLEGLQDDKFHSFEKAIIWSPNYATGVSSSSSWNKKWKIGLCNAPGRIAFENLSYALNISDDARILYKNYLYKNSDGAIYGVKGGDLSRLTDK